MGNRDEAESDHARIAQSFRQLAPTYDRWIGRLEAPLIRRAVALLELRPGGVAIDWGCGTGQAFGPLQRGIGPSGRLIGVDLSPDMLSLAAAKVEAAGWRNVSLIESPIETASVPEDADAALLFFVPEVMRSLAALENAIGNLKPGGHVVALGPRWPPAWSPLGRLLLTWSGRRFRTHYDRKPWMLLAELTEGLEIELARMGAFFIAHGTYQGARSAG